jgi:hypothetical protein
MDQELNRLLAKVSNQDMLVQRLTKQHHDITNSLANERSKQYRLQQELKDKQHANR